MSAVDVVRAEQVGWDCFVLVYSNGTRQQCSRDTYYQAVERLGGAK